MKSVKGVVNMSGYKRFVHMRDVVLVCPVCNKPVHLGMSFRTSRWFWLHDDFYDYIASSEHRGESLVELSKDEALKLLHK